MYSLLTPRLKRRGVIIETEIEYRVGPYFVLAVNIQNVHWRRLIKTANRDVHERRSRWKQEIEADEKENNSTRASSKVCDLMPTCFRLVRLTRIEVLAELLAWMYNLHWVLYTPVCFMLYHLFPKTFRTYFLSSVADGK
jgi:hypothetical protein